MALYIATIGRLLLVGDIENERNLQELFASS